MTFRFVPSLSDAVLQMLMATYTHGEKPALRHRTHGIVLSHQGHKICKFLSVTRVTVSSGLLPGRHRASKSFKISHA